MADHVLDRLDDLVLGVLDAPLRRAVEAHLAGCAECSREHVSVEQAWANLSLALPPVAPSAGLRARILASALAGGRFASFIRRVAQLIDVTADKARALLEAIDDPASWSRGPTENSFLYHLAGGPLVSQAVVGFVKQRAGTGFPDHRHLGEETVLVLQGHLSESGGNVLHPGDEHRMPKESSHRFSALPGADLIYLVVIQDGVEIGGVVMKPGDPRI